VERIGFSSLIGLIASASLLVATPSCLAQGGEPQYFAIRSARVVPVSGPPMDDATIIVARGVIVAVAKDATIPPTHGSSKARALPFIPVCLTPLPTWGFRLRPHLLQPKELRGELVRLSVAPKTAQQQSVAQQC